MSRLLIHESPLQVLPSLAVKIGLNEAIILQQLHYWLHPDHNKNIHEGLHWVYNSYEQWQKQFAFWSKETIKRAIHSLEKMNLILSRKFNEDKFDHRKWYSINYKILQQLECTNNRSGQNDTIDIVPVNDRWGQNDPIGQNNLTPPIGTTCSDHYKEQRLLSETTTKTHSARAQMSQQMLDLWNQTFNTTPAVKMSPLRQSRLERVLLTHFSNDLQNWQQFCNNIQSSAFLQGKGPRGWRATLDWCLEDANLFKILEGNYRDVSEPTPGPSPDQTLSQVQSQIEALPNPQHRAFALGICAHLSPGTYTGWFRDMHFDCSEEGRVMLAFSSKFKRDYVDANYRSILEQLMQTLYPGSQLELGVQKGCSLPQPSAQCLPEIRPEDTTVMSMVKDLARQFSQQEATPQVSSAKVSELFSSDLMQKGPRHDH